MLDDDGIQQEAQFEVERVSLLQRFRLLFSHWERWRNLNWTIVSCPDVAANYVLRGELLLNQGDVVGAISDFRRALELAAARVDQDDWGVVAQAMQDRALAGLRDALRRAARYNPGTDETN